MMGARLLRKPLAGRTLFRAALADCLAPASGGG